MNDITPAFRSAVRSHLDRLTSDLIPVLRQVAAYPYPVQVHHLDFEVFPDGFTDGFPIRAFYMDADNTEYLVQAGGQAEYPCDVDPGLLDIDAVYDSDLEDEFDEREPDADHMSQAAHIAIEWFAECWVAAGGTAFSRPAFIGSHDSRDRYDLVKRKWA